MPTVVLAVSVKKGGGGRVPAAEDPGVIDSAIPVQGLASEFTLIISRFPWGFVQALYRWIFPYLLCYIYSKCNANDSISLWGDKEM